MIKSIKLLDVLLDAKLIKSKTEGKHLLKQGAIKFLTYFTNKTSSMRTLILEEKDKPILFSGCFRIGRKFLEIKAPYMFESIKDGVVICPLET